ncbi:MAG TPA: NAD(+) synthase [Verrucomicrobiae bacterium]|nr:NAD(+) synthase [Verrucomicrobiae bacterium]
MTLEKSADSNYIRVATACPEVALTDVATNTQHIKDLYSDAIDADAALVVFPEMSVTGYSIGDLVQNNQLLANARTGLTQLAEATANKPTAMVVGLPLAVGSAIYNCAAVLADGQVKGIVPKSNMPTYGEFYEKRWFQAWDQPNIEVEVAGKAVPFGTDLLLDINGTKVGVEICEDLWVADPPSRKLAENGAHIIANPSASPELIGKADYRRQLVAQQSARLVMAYLYAGCDPSESTMDIVMSGHQLIAESGRIVAERTPLSDESRLQIADIDIQHLEHDKRKDTNTVVKTGAQIIRCGIDPNRFTPDLKLNKYPFLPPEDSAEREQRLDRVIAIQATGLAQRAKSSHQERVVLGLSGGLDSTLALLVAVEAAKRLGKEPKDFIHTITMPGEASSDRTQSNAVKLAQSLGVPNTQIPIGKLSQEQLLALGHDGETQDITYENVQARLRTSILFNYANKAGGMVLGTGDLSEIAQGWCTYNGDHMSHYNVNASIPKTLVRHLVAHLTTKPSHETSKTTLEDILQTPVSPELVSAQPGQISQETEAIIGPYALTDFFLYYLIRWGDAPNKIQFLAEQAFKDDYSPEEISKWLGSFLKRFTQNQFKRSAMPDGPKVGSVALSPRGDWRMPSDIPSTALWS